MFERIAPEQHDTLEGVAEPSENPLLVGHRDAAAMVAAAYTAGKLPHALIMAGPRGIGKATLAFHIAHHLLKHPAAANAPDLLAEPDPASPLFRQIAVGAHPSILHLTRPFDDKTKKFKTRLTIDEVRRVSRFLSLTSHDGSYRVVIVDPADDMNLNAANALLKNLEEPPARTVFLLVVHSTGILLPTIRSRCQLIRLQPLASADVETALRGLGVPLKENARAPGGLIERAGGSIRNAIMLSEFGGLEIADTIDALVKASDLDIAMAYRLADAVSGRENEIRFDLMNAHMLDIAAGAASEAASTGDPRGAVNFARVWQELLIAISDTDTYNLDRKQHALNMILRLHDSLRM
jgi:DNA polymerase-3 subunit delta'